MPRAETLLSQPPQPGSGIIQSVVQAGGFIRIRLEKDVAILGNEEHNQPIDDAQDLAIVILRVELSSSEPVAQRGVGWMGKEAAAKGGNGLCNAIAQVVEHTRALLLSRARPLF